MKCQTFPGGKMSKKKKKSTKCGYYFWKGVKFACLKLLAPLPQRPQPDHLFQGPMVSRAFSKLFLLNFLPSMLSINAVQQDAG